MEYHSGGSLPLLGRPRYCPGANANGGYLCETGHCCGETGCCTYYYELWWFWLLWTVLILFSCCCAYRHRRAKLRVQQQQRQREISLLAYHGANSYPSSMLDLSFLTSLKLPSYEEVAAQPSTPPPPYSSVFTAPRYPQPPRTADPHLLTQHGPLLHRPLSDGPSSLSSDNSSSCSCDSCCPSSPCSSSLSAPVTYETDTSHASTPSEATPLTLDVTMETIAAAATCLELNKAQFASERTPAAADAAAPQELVATDSSASHQTVTVAVVTRAASPHPLPSPASDLTLPAGSPMNQQLDISPCTPIVSTCSSSTLPSPSGVDAAFPSIQVISTEDPAWGPQTIPIPEVISVSGATTPAVSASGSPTATETPDSRTNLVAANVPSSPSSVTSLDVGRTLTLDSDFSLVPIPSPSHLSQAPSLGPTNPVLDQEPETIPSELSQAPDPAPSDLLLGPNPQPDATLVANSTICISIPVHSNLTSVTDAASSSPALAQSQNVEQSPGSSVVQVAPSPGSALSLNSGSVVVLVSCPDSTSVPNQSGPSLVLPQSKESNVITHSPSDVQAVSSSSSSCPAITIESESSLAPSAALFPSSPPFVPSPPVPHSVDALSPTSLPPPALLLDPLTALHQSDKGGSSSGHVSSLSPSPRSTQSPPKQTLFSPCVDVFEPGPPSWEDDEEEQEVKDNDEDEDEDMGADESQYRHRRLTGDSGIEVCRCRVEEEDDEEEEEEEEDGERKEDGKRGGGGGGDKKVGVNADLHDSVDCPARGQVTTGEGLTLCTPTTTPTPEESGKVVIVMETV